MAEGISASETAAPPLVSLSASGPLGMVRAGWTRWKKIARAVGVVQTRLLMVFFYFVVVFPVGLLMRMSGDPLHLKVRSGSNWTPHRHQDPTLENAHRQF